MERYNPSWYDALQEDPFTKQMLTKEKAGTIRRRAVELREPTLRTARSSLRKAAYAAVLSVTVIGAAIWMINFGDLRLGTTIDKMAASDAGATGSSGPDVGQGAVGGDTAEESPIITITPSEDVPVDDKFMGEPVKGRNAFYDLLLEEREPSDSEWLDFIYQIEAASGLDEFYSDQTHKLLANQPINEDTVFVFTQNVSNLGTIKTNFYLFRWETDWEPFSVHLQTGESGLEGWSGQTMGMYRYDEQIQEKLGLSNFKIDYYRLQELSLFVGLSANPDISSVRITDEAGDIQYAESVLQEDGLTYWYLSVLNATGLYNVEPLNASGDVITERRIRAS